MANMNVGRWIIGGVVAAVVLFVVDFVVNGLILAQQWDAAMTAFGLPTMTEQGATTMLVFALCDLIVGLGAVWIYVGIRTRFGAGVTTAIYAGLAAWAVGYLAPMLSLMSVGVLPAALGWTGIVVGIIQVPAATVAGAYLYKEE